MLIRAERSTAVLKTSELRVQRIINITFQVHNYSYEESFCESIIDRKYNF